MKRKTESILKALDVLVKNTSKGEEYYHGRNDRANVRASLLERKEGSKIVSSQNSLSFKSSGNELPAKFAPNDLMFQVSTQTLYI